MKLALDEILREKGLAGILVMGNADHNPAMVYLTGVQHVSNALLVKKTGQAPAIVVNPMEREEAARAGLQVYTFNDFQYYELYRNAGGNIALAESLFYQRILEKADLIAGKVAV